MNAQTAQTLQTRNAEILAIHSDREAAVFSAPAGASVRTIVQRWKSPARAAAVNISAAPYELISAQVPETYSALLHAVLDSAAKNILKRYVESYNVRPSEIPANLFSHDALMEEAAGSNNEWLTKEELAAAWETSETRKRYVSDPRYTQSKEFRVVVNWLADNYLRLAGKTSQYKESDLDVMVAKLADADMNTDFGTFVLRRVESIRAKPAKESVNLDLL